MISLPVRRFLDDQEIFASPARPQSPSVSVILPVYCHNGPLLERAISSVLSQEFTDFELIIVDDGSRDGSFDTAMRFAKQDCRIVVIRHQLNSGLPAIRVNEGIMASRGTYIAYQFDDDEWLPNCLGDLHTEIIAHEAPCLVYGLTKLWDCSSEQYEHIMTLGQESLFNLFYKNIIANNSVLHDRCIFDIVGMYDPHILLRRLCDWDLWMRFARKIPFIKINKVIANAYSKQQGSLGSTIPFYDIKYIMKYISFEHNNQLTPENIQNYEVAYIPSCFSSQEKDFIYRVEIFPFLNKTTYIIKNYLKTYALSRRTIKNIIVNRYNYSTSIDICIRNFLCKICNAPYHFVFISSGSFSVFHPTDQDIFIFHGQLEPYSLPYLKKLIKNDIPTSYIMDDDLFQLGQDYPNRYSYLKTGSERYNTVVNLVRHVDCVFSYSQYITSKCKKYTNRIYKLSTNIPEKYISQEHFSKKKERIHFGIFCSVGRRDIFKILWGALEKFSELHSNRIEITFYGLDPSEFPSLKCPVHFHEFVNNYDYYLQSLQKEHFHFQICPLDGEKESTRSKSPIKFLEGTVSGAISLFSDVPPYNTLPHDVCITVPNSIDSWFQALTKAVSMTEKERYELYKNACDFICSKYSSESQYINFIAGLDYTVLQHNLRKTCKDNYRIAYVAHEAALGGATLHILRHLLLMQDIGIKSILYLPTHEKAWAQDKFPTLPKYASKFGVEVQYIPCRSSIHIINRTKEDYTDGQLVANIFKKEGVGLICSATYMPALGIAAEQLGVPNVTTLHQYYPNPQFTKREDVNIQAIHSSSNRYALEYYKLLNIPAIRIVCPVGPEFFGCYASNLEHAIEDFTQENPMHILVSGTLQPRKGQLEAILAVSKLLEKGIPVRLTLIGYDALVPEYAMKCREAAHTLPEGTVTFIGFTEHPENYYHNTCHVLLCSSIDESMPQTILQSMAAGVFAVSTNCGGVSEIIKDNYNGILLPENTPDVLAEGITRLVKMGATERLFMLNNAHETISAIATPEFVRSELINLYNIAFEELKKHKTRLSIGEPLPEPSSIFKQSSMEGNSLTANEAATSNLCPSRPIGHQRFYPITLTSDSFSRIRLIFTCTTGIAHGKVTARLLFKGKLLREASLNMENICYNQWTDFTILPLNGYKNQCVTLCLSMEYVGDDMLLVYENRERRTLIYKIKNKLGIPCAEKDVLLFNLL